VEEIRRNPRRGLYRVYFAITIGAVTFGGWLFGIDLMRRLLPGSIPMNPLQALVLLAACASLLLRWKEQPASWRARSAHFATLFVLGVGGMRLFDGLIGTQLCPDYWLFGIQSGPGERMVPLEGLCDVLLGLGLWTLDRGDAETMGWHPQWIPAPIVPITMFSFAAWLFEGHHMTDSGGMLPIGVASAWGNALVAMGVWNARSDRGPVSFLGTDNPGSRMVRYMLVASGVMPLILAGLSVIGIKQHWFSAERGLSLAVFTGTIAIATITIGISTRLRTLDNLRRRTLKDLKERVAKDEGTAKLSAALMKIEEVLRTTTTSPHEAAAQLLSFLADFISVPQLCLYAVEDGEDEPQLVVLGCFAHSDIQRLNQRFALGDGLVGQCAVTRRPLFMDDVPKDYFRIRSGTLDTAPRQLVFVPLVVNEETVGVLEIATLRSLSEEHREFLLSSARIIAYALFRMREQLRMQRLLSDLAAARSRTAPATTAAP
jgi:putative methionine-R-sulfoxide reductase with GAF domain